MSLLSKYLNNEEGKYKCIICADRILKNQNLFDKCFPTDKIPECIRYQVKLLLTLMKFYGWSHDDCHAGNFVVDDNNVVKVIDFDCVSKCLI